MSELADMSILIQFTLKNGFKSCSFTMHRRAGLILKESTAFGGCAQISKETAKVSEGCSVDRE